MKSPGYTFVLILIDLGNLRFFTVNVSLNLTNSKVQFFQGNVRLPQHNREQHHVKHLVSAATIEKLCVREQRAACRGHPVLTRDGGKS